MGNRRRRNREGNSGPREFYRPAKSNEEARTERVTWALLVLMFALVNLTEDFQFLDETNLIPRWSLAFIGGVILVGSGLYQYSRRWRVSPSTWIIGTLLLLMGAVNVFIDRTLDLTGIVLLATIGVISLAFFTGET